MSAPRRSRSPTQALAIHIDVVTLEGITMTPVQTRQFGSALQAELQRLATLQDRRRTWSATTVAAERALQVALQPPHRAAQLGVEVGRSLWAAIGGRQ
jgi:hypothetical protein